MQEVLQAVLVTARSPRCSPARGVSFQPVLLLYPSVREKIVKVRSSHVKS